MLALRNVERARRAAQIFPITSTSAHMLEFRSYATFGNPLTWIREKLDPTIKETQPTEDVAATRRRADANPNLFATVVKKPPAGDVFAPPKKAAKDHKYSTANFKISHRKLNMLGRQISGKPVNTAIFQMAFSEKRVSKRIKSMLVVARDHAMNYKRMDGSKLVVAEAWVTKGPKSIKVPEFKGRRRFGIRIHPDSRLHVLLKEGKTPEEKLKEERQRKLKRVVSAAAVREDKPLRNPGPMWAW